MGNQLQVARKPVKPLDFQQQCLRVLRCTAHALANSPGGLRFQAGTRPWLDVLTSARGDANLSIPQGV